MSINQNNETIGRRVTVVQHTVKDAQPQSKRLHVAVNASSSEIRVTKRL